MKNNSVTNKAKRIKAALVAGVFGLSATAGGVHAYFEQQDFWGAGTQSGGILTFEDTAANQLTITIDNTSNFSGIITGAVFNISQDILAASLVSLTDGNGNDISSSWQVLLDVNNNITPGNTKFDVGFNTTTGINGGIYNDGTASNTNNAFPDIATMVLSITSPNPWTFTDVLNDSILRTQRTGANGNGSDKIVTSSSSGGSTTSGGSSTSTSGGQVSEPGILILLAIGLLGQAFVLMRRRRLGL
ncbi:PEP-CTERM sorting domain-containing protein [Nitrosomonas marina]|uniref:PEP-CTERM protein-sorting domain-containing protein n=1 Tax=Nitrosomonas marina TaxID=917 RepID=A0A1H8D5Z1_9PROT|nr:PEP-CTERM sorting domain-containing protein [Nitrosomonas marina]SEN02700.1 PEP-CTERM protein-sorting domain-containing protein [Nitrosomonas marina]